MDGIIFRFILFGNLLALFISCSSVRYGRFHWTISIVQHFKDHENGQFRFVRMVDVNCQSDVCNNFYARIRALNDVPVDDVDEFSRVTPGMKPRILMKIKQEFREEIHLADALVVESDHCMCLKNSTFEWSSTGSGPKTCLAGTTVCEMVFVAPIPITRFTQSVMITVESAETSLFISPKSVTYYNTNQLANLGNIFDLNVGSSLSATAVENLAIVKKVPESSRLWVLPFGNHTVFTSSEFETKQLARMRLPSYGVPNMCSNWNVDIKDILSLPDRIIAATKFGLFEYTILDGKVRSTEPGLILPVCIVKLDTVNQNTESDFYVMALANSSTTFYFGHLMRDSPLYMKEAKDELNKTLCEFLSYGEGCQILSFASSSSKKDKIFALAKAKDYLLTEYTVSSKSFAVVKKLSQINIQNSRLPNSGSESFNLSGMAFTKLHAFHLFLWGNILLYSPNAGQKIFKVMELHDDVILLFDTSFRGDFACVTAARKVFFGKVGSLSIRHLKSVNAAESLTFFFGTSGDLFQLSMQSRPCNSSVCMKKTRVPLREALHQENVYLKTVNKLRFCSYNCLEECDKVSLMSCGILPNRYKQMERNCPFAKIKLTTYDFQYFSRIALILHCRDRINSVYVTKLNEIASDLFWEERIVANSEALDNCLWEDASHEAHRLPKSISLGRSVCYPFKIDIFLDHSDFLDFYFHNYKMNEIKLSVIISKADDLLVDVKRSIFFTDSRIVFQVRICDSGKKRIQNLPGTQQELISPEIKVAQRPREKRANNQLLVILMISNKVVGCGLNCIATSFQDTEDVQGYFTSKILLGCPPGQKVVFDPYQTKATGKPHFCDDESPSIPCFHFDRVFSPVFNHVDEATLKTEEFSGNYTLVIVAGGSGLDRIQYFSEDEITQFNYEAGSSLIWAPQQKYDGKPVFTKHSSLFSWLCGSNSPCSGIAPVFPHPPVFYFIVEFSNREVDNSNCDFTFRFTIKVEGIAPGSINPSLIIVLVSIGLMIIGLLVYFFLKKRYNHVLERFQLRNIFRLIFRPNEVENSDTSDVHLGRGTPSDRKNAENV